MRAMILLGSLLLTPTLVQAVIFQGLIETATINTFLCSGDAQVAADCSAAVATGAIGYDLSGGKTLQLFNNQTYFLRKMASKEQYEKTVNRLSGADLQSKMQGEGWGAMGGYCIIITTDPITAQVVSSSQVLTEGQVKVVVQLWYSGDQLLQLWSQDVALLSPSQSFNVTVSSDVDPLSGLLPSASPAALTTIVTMANSFLSQLDIQPNNRVNSLYNSAIASPRSVKIQVAG